MHGSGERDAHNPCPVEPSNAVSNGAVDAAQYIRQVLHLPTGLWCSSGYSASALASKPGAPPTPKAATLTAVVPTSRPMMMSAVLALISLRLDGVGLSEDGVNEIVVAAEPWLQGVQDRRDG